MGLINPDLSGLVDGQTADAADVKNPINTITNEFNGNIEAANIKDATITAAKLASGTISSASVSLTNAQANFDTNVQTNTSYAAIGTQISVTTTVANQIIWVNFAGSLRVSKASGGTYIQGKVSLLIGGVDKSATFECEQMGYVASMSDGDYYRSPLGFSVPFVIATPAATTIQLQGLKTYGINYRVLGTLSAFVTGA